MKKLLMVVATLAMVMVAATPALAQGGAAAQSQYVEEPVEKPGEPVTATGVVEPLGQTTFMYGSHDLIGSVYVIESDAVNLSVYEGQEVTVSGTLVYEESELEGGPPLINVESVEPSGGDDPGEPDPGEPVSLSGVIESLEVNSFQYGTHTVVNDADGASYALQSDSVALGEFEGVQAEISGTLVPGYEDGQVEGGPPLVEVTSVEPSADDGGTEDVSGTILEVREGSVLVEDAGGGQYDFTITENTAFTDGVVNIPEETPPRAPNAADLASGLEVSVAPAGEIATSFPAQGEAANITFLSPWHDGGEGPADPPEGGGGEDPETPPEDQYPSDPPPGDQYPPAPPSGGGSGSGDSGNGAVGGGGSAAEASDGILPDTSGASLIALGAGALLVGAGLLARRIVR